MKNSTLCERINRYFNDQPCVMLQLKGDWVYVLPHHYRFTNYKDAPRNLIGKNTIGLKANKPNDYIYLDRPLT
jgi:hypothetical protein